MARSPGPSETVVVLISFITASLTILFAMAANAQIRAMATIEVDTESRNFTPRNATQNNLGPPLFLPAVTYDTGGHNPESVVIADLNDDGRPDLIVANKGQSTVNDEGSVAVLLGMGDGTFQQAVDYNPGVSFANSIAVADVNGDAKADLVVTNGCFQSTFCPHEVSVLLGNGNGTFQAPRIHVVEGLAFFGIHAVVADVNNDHKADLIVVSACADSACTNGSVSVSLGNGDGTFGAAVAYDSGGVFPTSVAVADVNGDNRPDLLVANFCSQPCGLRLFQGAQGTIAVFLGNGDGTFQAAGTYGAGGNSTTFIARADLNGDGNNDLVAANCGPDMCGPGSPGGNVGVLLGNGDGTFQAVVPYEAANSPRSVALADLNADGNLDVVVGNWGTPDPGSNAGAITALLGNGDGTLQQALTYPSGGAEVASISVADVNDDARPDVAAANVDDTLTGATGVVSVLLNGTSFCTAPSVTVSASRTLLWPPNGKMVPITISGKVTERDCRVTTATYAVKDEYGQIQPSGPVTLGAGGVYSFTLLLQASRLGTDLDGRRYTITVNASNNAGKTGSSTGSVIVPHDQGH